MNPVRILVTGGAGFIGSHTVDLLLQMDKEVVVLDNLSSGKLTNLNLRHPNLEFIEGDVLEYPLVVDIAASCDAVLHLAAIASVQQTIVNPIYSFQVNTQGFLHVLEAIREVRRPVRLVYASSAAVYGDVKELPCRDGVPLLQIPLSPYALQKLQDEQYAELYAKLYQIKSLGLRYFNVYGERQDPNSPYSGVISRFISAYQNNAELLVYGDGLQSRDFIHVHDVAMANVLALQQEVFGTLNIATGEPQTLLQVIKYIEEAGEAPATYHMEPARPGDIRVSYGTNKLALEQLEFTPRVPLKDGLRTMVARKSQSQ